MAVDTTVKRTFARGVHPPERKELVSDCAIEVLPVPEEVRIPLLQHLGAPCEPTIKPRAEVKVGEVIGKPGGFVSAPVHASVDGTAARGTVATLPNGRHVDVIPIKASEEQSFSGSDILADLVDGEWPTAGLEKYEPKQIADAASAAGLVGQGGAAFPTHVKLTTNEEKPIDTLLLNGCECEPYLASDYRLMLESPGPIVTGAMLAGQATGAASVIICIEDNKPEAIAAMRAGTEGTPVRVQVVKTKYPQGGEKQLINAVLDREVPAGGLPLDVGVVVVNVGTAASLAMAVLRERPLTHRVVSVSGSGIAQPKNLFVPIGTSYRVLIDYCGGIRDSAARVIAGGPMMGFTLGSLDVPVTKGTSAITVLSGDEARKASETACVRCGRCVDACPMRLVPTRLALAARAHDADLARRYHAMLCMECGSCAYVCPASLPLVQLIRLGKVLANK